MTYEVVAVSGIVTHVIRKGMSYDDALDFCEEHNWEYDYNGGLIWDLEIEEDGYYVIAM